MGGWAGDGAEIHVYPYPRIPVVAGVSEFMRRLSNDVNHISGEYNQNEINLDNVFSILLINHSDKKTVVIFDR